ncbi:hypothetical protein N7510_006355 [Penicillium lagena]|uniref:uncharacterized protein n=1 Tax=Penicillium lagena TaxID=94218 RepID=UPI00253F6C80|nr:uncharacterized protein N7510_006355 [Penicillium lagena]KAJ5613161.1 hypothetical protein N7510_006355 [Penicillium lagena]
MALVLQGSNRSIQATETGTTYSEGSKENYTSKAGFARIKVNPTIMVLWPDNHSIIGLQTPQGGARTSARAGVVGFPRAWRRIGMMRWRLR